MADKKEKQDPIAEFRCKKCGFSNTYVRKGDNEEYKVRVCRRCGFEEKIPIENIQKKK